MTTTRPITVIVPVYGRSRLLGEALNSVLALSDSRWQLLIADDGSDEETQAFLTGWLTKASDQRIRVDRRPRNIGLFANLNIAIRDCQTEWVLLLCSDDVLLPSAIDRLAEVMEQYEDSELILSTFDSIDEAGVLQKGESHWFHDKISRKTEEIQPNRFVPYLLRWGSLNGNLTGMAFKRSLWESTGGFKEEWRHAADWDWLAKAAEKHPVVLNRNPIARVRTHDGQLSNENRKNGNELMEIADLVSRLREHTLLEGHPKRLSWAGHIMQFQLWNLLKAAWGRKSLPSKDEIMEIEKAAGLANTTIKMLQYMPIRMTKKTAAIANKVRIKRDGRARPMERQN